MRSAAASIDLHEEIVHAAKPDTDARTPDHVHAHDRHRPTLAHITIHWDIATDHGLPKTLPMSMATPRAAEEKETPRSTQSDRRPFPTPTQTPSKP
jgi:hypothetical protein